MKLFITLLAMLCVFQTAAKPSCDTLYLKSGVQIAARNVEMKATVITFEKCGQEGYNHFVIAKSQVLYIKYSKTPIVDLWKRDSSLNYNIKVHFLNSKQQRSGYIYKFRDSSLLVSKSSHAPFYQERIEKALVSDIDFLEIGSKKRFRRAIGIGAATGFIVGVITGVVILDKYKRREPSTTPFSRIIEDATRVDKPIIVFGTIGIITGAFLGGGVGDVKILIPIKGKDDAYINAQKRLITFY